MFSLEAEVYKWQDETGAVRYSNKPPEDESRILEQIPTEKVPLVEDTDGVVYYLNVPVGDAGKDIFESDMSGQMMLSPELVNEPTKETAVKPIYPSLESPLDLTALTVRLAEVEKALEKDEARKLKEKTAA